MTFHYCPPLPRRGRGRGKPGGYLDQAPFQHPYTRKSTATPSGVKSMFDGLPIVNLSLASPSTFLRAVYVTLLINIAFTIKVNFFGLMDAFSPYNQHVFDLLCRSSSLLSLPSCSISTHDPRGPLSRPVGAIIAACNNPCNPSCDTMHGITHNNCFRTVRDPTRLLLPQPPVVRPRCKTIASESSHGRRATDSSELLT